MGWDGREPGGFFPSDTMGERLYCGTCLWFHIYRSIANIVQSPKWRWGIEPQRADTSGDRHLLCISHPWFAAPEARASPCPRSVALTIDVSGLPQNLLHMTLSKQQPRTRE